MMTCLKCFRHVLQGLWRGFAWRLAVPSPKKRTPSLDPKRCAAETCPRHPSMVSKPWYVWHSYSGQLLAHGEEIKVGESNLN